jgi:hypothetical protein
MASLFALGVVMSSMRTTPALAPGLKAPPRARSWPDRPDPRANPRQSGWTSASTEIDGVRWPVKHVIALATGAERTRFQSRDSLRAGRDSGLQSDFGIVGVECLTNEFERSREIFFEGGLDLAGRKDEPTFGLAAGTQFDGQ